MTPINLFNQSIVAILPHLPKALVGVFSRPYIAGITLDEAVAEIARLNAKGLLATTDVLGENISTLAEAEANEKELVEVLDAIRVRRLDSNLSLKLTQLGLMLDRESCYQSIKRIVAAAKEQRNFVRIDMEDSPTVDGTLEIYKRLRRDGFENVGVVIQSYLRRSETDVRELVKMNANFRLCKGIYIEPEEIAFKGREEIRNNFLKLLRIILEGKCYPGIATHDEALIEGSYKIIQEMKLNPNQYEFQMLLGVREELRGTIVRKGHRLRVYVPFGDKWYAYSVRRLRENPSLAGYIAKATIRKIFGMES